MRVARGFTLIEILVAMVIGLVALMGAAGLIARSVQQEVESYQRLQALNLLQDMVGRLNANRLVADCYSNGANGMQLGYQTSAPTSCAAGTTEQRTRADADLQAWDDALLGAAQQNSDDDNVGAMIGARGCIDQLDAVARIYRISVVWQGVNETVAPNDALACGKDQYGSEKQRRVVTATVRIGDLS